jgi:hypothetical protein
LFNISNIAVSLTLPGLTEVNENVVSAPGDNLGGDGYVAYGGPDFN